MADWKDARISKRELIWRRFVAGWRSAKPLRLCEQACVSLLNLNVVSREREIFQGAQGKHNSKRKAHDNEAQTIKCKPRPRGAVEKTIMENALGIV